MCPPPPPMREGTSYGFVSIIDDVMENLIYNDYIIQH